MKVRVWSRRSRTVKVRVSPQYAHGLLLKQAADTGVPGMEEKQDSHTAGGDRSLQDDMLRMMGNPTFCDIVFLCGPEEEECPALRMLVAARSPMLESMLLTSGMAETRLSRIPLPSLEASTMRICIEFFHTDAVRWHRRASFLSCMKVVSAARLFLVSKLELLAVSHMASSLSNIKEACESYLVDLIQAYSYAVDSLQESLSDKHMQSIMQGLNGSIIRSERPLYLRCQKHLSEQAMIHLVSNLSARTLKVPEYIKFHLVFCWSYAQLHDDLELLQNICKCVLPWLACDVKKLLRDDAHAGTNSLQSVKPLVDLVASCLEKANIDFSKIPALVLSKIIEPLGLVPLPMIITAYRLQALSKSDLCWGSL